MNASEYFESAMGWIERGDKSAAIAHLQQGLLLDPANGSAWANRGNLLLQTAQPFEALVSIERAITLLPNAWELKVNRAAALAELNRDDEAMAECDRALAIAPTSSLALGEKANLHYRRGDYLEAAECYRRALASDDPILSAHVAEYHLFRGMALLAAGDFAEGWAEYEWRVGVPTYSDRHLPYPPWAGESGRNVLVTNEQGFGDAIQFMRLARTLKERHGGKVYLEVRSPLARIARTLVGIDGVTAFGDPLPADIEFTVSAMSLPHRLGLIIETTPAEPYLAAWPGRWKKRVDGLGAGLKVGLCWAGEARSDIHTRAIDARRSMRLAQLEPVLRVPGVHFVSLQVGKEASQSFGTPVANWTHEIDDFADTASLISALDLVIAVDTSTAHLAGALGKPTWLLSRFDQCWRWMGDREDSPWYPTLRQFRQRSWGDWAGVVQRVAAELDQLVHGLGVRRGDDAGTASLHA